MIRWTVSLAIVVASTFGAGAASMGKEVEPPWQKAASPSVAAVANWVIGSGDNRGLPFLIVDKAAADVAVFDAKGDFRGEAPALVGMARGDVVDADIGDRPLSTITPSERITQAGRFFAQFGSSEGMSDVLWIDFRTSLSLHPVVTSNPNERRLERLDSVSSDDNRITFGCVNVSEQFYRSVVKSVFADGVGIVYIVPEIDKLRNVFPKIETYAEAAARTTSGA